MIGGQLTEGMEEPTSEDEELMEAEAETGELMSQSTPSLASETYHSESDEATIKTESVDHDTATNSAASTLSSHSVVALQTNSGTLLVTDINTVLKPDLSSELSKKSNRETMSYLKSKRILRHKNHDYENKKPKVE